MADGSVIIDIKADPKQAVNGLERVRGKMNGLAAAARKITAVIGAAFAVHKLVEFGKEAIQLGSDVAEVQNVVEVAFGEMSYKAEAFASSAIRNFGMSALAAKQTASTYMAMAKNMGLNMDAASDMAVTLAGLTGDVASFYNISQDLADIKLKSVFTGETETLKDLGIVMTQANLEAYALSSGITKSVKSMSQAELVTLRYNFVLDQLAMASRDFVRTQDSWANQTRILSMQWQEFMSIIGQALTQVLLPAVRVLNSLVSSLISMANALRTALSSLFGGENTQLKQTEQNVSGISSGIGGAVENQEALTDATKETNKEQARSLATFDEVNKLAGETADTSAAGSIDMGVGGLTTEIVPVETIVEEIDPSNSKLAKFFERLRDSIQPTIDAVQRLWEQLKVVGGFAGGALVDFYERFLVPVGSWIMGEGLPRLIDALTHGLAQVDWERINQALATLWEALAPFAQNVGEGLLWLWENVLVPFGTWVGNNLAPLFIEGIAAALTILNEIWELVKPGLQWLWDNFLQPVAAWTGGIIVSVLEGIVSALERFGKWCSENHSLIQDIAIVIASFMAAWVIVNLPTILSTIAFSLGAFVGKMLMYVTTGGLATAVTTALGAAINFLTSPLTLVTLAIGVIIAIIALLIKHWDEVKEVASVVCESIKNAFVSAWEAIQTAWSVASGYFSAIWNAIKVTFAPVVEYLSGLFTQAWENIKQIFGGMIDFITGVFTGDWETAWDGIKGIFTGVWNGIVSTLESAVNLIIKGINWLISQLNKISFELPDWVPAIGGKSFGFNIPKISEVSIPRLAAGSVIPPNREFLAVLGDNKQETEVVSPLSTMKQALLEALQEAGGVGGGTQQINLVVDGRTLAKVIVPQINRMTQQAGKPVLLI